MTAEINSNGLYNYDYNLADKTYLLSLSMSLNARKQLEEAIMTKNTDDLVYFANMLLHECDCCEKSRSGVWYI